MLSNRSTKFLQTALAVAAFSPLAACAVSREPVLTHQLGAGPRLAEIELVRDKGDPELRRHFAALLEEAAQADGLKVASGSRWVADFAISSHPADTTVAPVESESPVAGIEGTRMRWLDKCLETKVRGSLAIFERGSNRLVGKAEGDYRGCPGEDAMLEDLARLLVRAVREDAASSDQE